jgi:hypothetical protein
VAVVIYALILSAVVFTGSDQFLNAVLGEDRLLVISEARLSDIRVTYGGREVRPRPGFHPGSELTVVLFAPMRAPRRPRGGAHCDLAGGVRRARLGQPSLYR